MGSLCIENNRLMPSLVSYCDGQRVVCGFSATYAIYVFDAEGRLGTTIELDRRRSPVSLSEREPIVRRSGYAKYIGKSPAQVAHGLTPLIYVFTMPAIALGIPITENPSHRSLLHNSLTGLPSLCVWRRNERPARGEECEEGAADKKPQ